MPEKTWYLKHNGYVVAKFEQEDEEYGFAGQIYTCCSWIGDEKKKPYEYKFHSHVICKWDGCSHWYFDGQDVADVDFYYHLHKDGLEEFFASMSFVWKLAEIHWTKYIKETHPDIPTVKYVEDEYESELVDYILKDYEITEEI